MKVGILTFHSSYNFGANLQALAVQSALETSGADPIIINYQPPSKMGVYKEITDRLQVFEHERFIQGYLKTSELLTTAEQIETYCREHLDVVLVGSDQVFRLLPLVNIRKSLRSILGRRQNPLSEAVTKVPPPYWLDWENSADAPAIRKVSIAASAGATNYRFLYPGLSKRLGKCLRQFDSVTVRDGWTENMVKRLTKGRVVPGYCPDPVFSLRDNFSDPACELPDSERTNTILLSVDLDSGWIAEFTEEAHRHGYQVASLPNSDREFPMDSVDFNIRLPLSPLKWFHLLSTAAGYVGIRFHALVSCIANNTPVISVETTPRFSIGYQKKSRLFDLCRRADLESRCLVSKKELHQIPPKDLLHRLFETSSQEKADRFAKAARIQFQDSIQRALVQQAD